MSRLARRSVDAFAVEKRAHRLAAGAMRASPPLDVRQLAKTALRGPLTAIPSRSDRLAFLNAVADEVAEIGGEMGEGTAVGTRLAKASGDAFGDVPSGRGG